LKRYFFTLGGVLPSGLCCLAQHKKRACMTSPENILPPSLDATLKTHMAKMASAIRILSMDAVQKANSGHPGLPLGCAELGAYLYCLLLKHNPKSPQWINRDRMILSAGHGSMWLYSCMHLSGFGLTLEDIKQFRQMHSLTPGHPESFITPGVETTTGPLGQGFGNAVGTALGLKILAKKFNADEFPIFNSHVYVLAGDGCLMEGVSAEAASFAGHLGLDNLVVFYDANDVTLDGPLEESCSEDTRGRYRSYGWDVFEVNGHDFDQIDRAVRQAIHHQKKPVLIIMKTLIGKGSPTKAGSHTVHGAPLGEEEIRLAKEQLGIPNEEFYVPRTVYDFFQEKLIEDAKNEIEWKKLFENWSRTFPEKRAEFDKMLEGKLPSDLEGELSKLQIKPSISGRKASQDVLNYLAESLPQLYAGSADLSSSDMIVLKKYPLISKERMAGRNIKFGIREFGMATMATGLNQTRMIQPVIGTFFTFSDYMKNAIRLAALMKEKVIYQFTHDSIFLGEDGPTHQPVEQLAGLRSIPHLHVIRPSGTHEVKMAWIAALSYKGPTALILSRQNVRDLPETIVPYAEGLGRGAYIVRKEKEKPTHTIIATGSELPLAMDVADALEKIGKSPRVVSMPCFDLFELQPESYKQSVLGKDIGKKISIEAASEFGWHKYIGSDGIAISVEDFGASAPASVLAKEYGFTVEAILDRIL
jgi:transketolase